MRTKGSVLIVLVLGLGTAFAMAVSGRGDGAIPEVVGIADKKSGTNRIAIDHDEQLQPDIRFDLSAIKRAVPEDIQASGLFQAKSWYAPPPPPPPQASYVSPPPPPPSAPNLPFTFIGRMIDGDEVTLFLMNSSKSYSVRISDVLDGIYRVEKITDKGVVFTYLPMNIQQELSFNSTGIGISSLSASVSTASIQPPEQFQQATGSAEIEIPEVETPEIEVSE